MDTNEPRNKRAAFKKKLMAALSGRQGFFAVLFVCLGIVGLTAFLTLRSPSGEVEPEPSTQSVSESLDESLASVATPVLVKTSPSPSPSPSPTMAPSASPKATAKAASKAAAPVSGEIIFGFATDKLLYSKTLDHWTTHSGVDIAAPEGTEVKAAYSGKVESVKKDDWLGYMVVIVHDNGLTPVYANLEKDIPVKEGKLVSAGTVIGTVGKSAPSECADEAHLHFEVRVSGNVVDPAKYINFK
jgi:murein DD-endopeptidase MepM/ murein hydrolase activator NlpD